MRQMPFSLTTEQMLARTKTVTRRLGWADLKPGTLLQAVEKSQGLKKGEKVRKLGVIRVVDVRREFLTSMFSLGKARRRREMAAEGFPGHDVAEYVRLFAKVNDIDPLHTFVTRIEFEHVQEACLA